MQLGFRRRVFWQRLASRDAGIKPTRTYSRRPLTGITAFKADKQRLCVSYTVKLTNSYHIVMQTPPAHA
jgi:hypothetical protein